jgi:hypothetical protein
MGHSGRFQLLPDRGNRMIYRNTKTGAVIHISGELKGGNWEEVKPEPKTPAKKPVKKTVKRD